MKFLCALSIILTIIVCAYAAELNWGEIGPKDKLLAKDKVSNRGIFALVTSKKYVFKQKSIDAKTITAIRVTDRTKKVDSRAELLYGGPGSKGLTMRIYSKRSKDIKSRVEVWGH